MSLPEVVGTDVSVVVVSYAGFTQVFWVIAFGVVLGVLHTGHTAVTEEVPHGWGAKKAHRSKNTAKRCIDAVTRIHPWMDGWTDG